MICNNNPLSKNDTYRYCRQLLLPEFSLLKQKQILETRVLVVGAGGLGSPCLQYLLAAGFRQLTIVDNDVVDLSNLHRQVIHKQTNHGVHKLDSAKQFLQDLDSNVQLNLIKQTFNNQNALQIIDQYQIQIIIECSDNPQTKYLTNDVASLKGIPLILGAALQWEGQLMVFHSSNKFNNNCYRCLFPQCPGKMGACNEAGVIGMCVGMIGQMQALECLKLVINPDYQCGLMYIFDGFNMNFRKAKLRKRQDNCVSCNHQIDISNYDYDGFVNKLTQNVVCDIQLATKHQQQDQDYQNMSWKQFIDCYKQYKQRLLIDVRPSNMFKIVNLQGFINVPLEKVLKMGSRKELLNSLEMEDEEVSVFCMCRRGNASREASSFIKKQLKVEHVVNLEGGIEQYGREYDSEIVFI